VVVDFVKIWCGYVIVMDGVGVVWIWGDGCKGVFGSGLIVDWMMFGLVVLLFGCYVMFVIMGYYDLFALLDDVIFWGWGMNVFG